MLETLKQIDTQLFLLINGKWHNTFFDMVCPWLREAKHWIPFYLLLLYLSWKHYGKTMIWIVLGAALLVFITDQFSANLVKNSVERLRPCNNPGLKQHVRLLVHCGQGYSFISAHATNHFAIAAYFIVLFRQWIPYFHMVAFLWAASISYSQIYVGVHYPFDVLVGAICGSIFGQYGAKLVMLKTEKI